MKRRAGTSARGLLRVLAGLAVTAAGGGVTALAFPPYNHWWLAPVGVAILVLAAAPTALNGRERRHPLARAFVHGGLWGLMLMGPLTHFSAFSLGNPVGWAALSITEMTYFAVGAWAWCLIARRWRHGGVAAVVLLSATEVLRSRWPFGGFPFGKLAYAMADAPVVGFARWAGTWGVSLLVIIAGVCLAYALRGLASRRLFGPVCLLAAGSCVLAFPAAIPLPWQAQEGTIRVAAIQGTTGTPPEDPDVSVTGYRTPYQVLGAHTTVTEQLARDAGSGAVDVVIWPENAADIDPRDDAHAQRLVTQAAQAVGVPILVGTVQYGERDGRTVRYNDLLMWDPASGAGDYYRKHRPVPFGEYIPMRELARHVSSQVDRVGTDMIAGEGPLTLTLPTRDGRSITAAIGICFEVAFDDILREGVEQGGQFIVIPTNNSSFSTSSEAPQQLAQGRVQAIVHGRTVVQVSTVGETAIITANGVVRQQTTPFYPSALVGDVELRSERTVADMLGDWPDYLTLGAAALLTVGAMVATLYQRLFRARR